MLCGLARVKSCSTVASTSFVSCGEALAMLQATGRPWRSAIAMFYCLFRGESGRQQRPFFRRTEAGVDEGLWQIEFATRPQVFGQRAQQSSQRAVALPLLKTATAGLIGRGAGGRILPSNTGAQNPEN